MSDMTEKQGLRNLPAEVQDEIVRLARKGETADQIRDRLNERPIEEALDVDVEQVQQVIDDNDREVERMLTPTVPTNDQTYNDREAKIEELRGQAMDLYQRYGELAKQALELIAPTDKEIEDAADMVLGMYADETTSDRTDGPIWDWDLFEQIVETRREAAEGQG